MKPFGQEPSSRAKKRFGQNFLTDETVLDTIIDACGVTGGDTVLEIGPGRGALTVRLARCAKRVIAIEIDTDLKPVLDQVLLPHKNTRVLYQDVLKTDFAALRDQENNGEPFPVVANLPYYISTPVIMKLLRDDVPPRACTVMVQKELALRMAASPGNKDYGELSVVVQYYASPRTVCDVPPSAFRPQPKVDSCVMNLVPLKTPPVTPEDRDFFFRVVKESFAHRRKTLVNSLSACGDPRLTRERILRAMSKNGIPPDTRAERLSIAQFADLSDDLL